MLEEIKYKGLVFTETKDNSCCSRCEAGFDTKSLYNVYSLYSVQNKFLIKRSRFLLVLSIILFLILSLITAVKISAQDIGGEAELITIVSEHNSDLDADIKGKLELEWFLPYGSAVDFENRAVITADSDEVEIWFKKFYIKEELGPFNAKIGRQPVSWAYGALINPVDYSLGAENLDRESRVKFVDGVELYYPINWGSGISLVGSNIDNEKEHKYAARARTTFRGYDLSLSYVSQPSEAASFERYGLTAKGDLKALGVYGALGLWQDEDINYDIFQIGSDYSYNFMSGSKLYLQAEYLRIGGIEDGLSEAGVLQTLGDISSLEEDLALQKVELINTNISYDINEFTSIGLMTVSYLEDGSTVFIPQYSYLFSSNLLLEIRGSLTGGNEEELFGGDTAAAELSLSYTF